VNNQEVLLARRPVGRLAEADLEIVATRLPALRSGEVLVENLWQSVDPSTRLRMNATTPDGYLPPFALGEALVGMAAGRVVESRAEEFREGDAVTHMWGYRRFSVVRPGRAELGGIGELAKVDASDRPLSRYLGVLGSTGLAAWAGLTVVADLKPSDIVWVSAAAGAVGSIAAQLAKARGNVVIGSARSEPKIAYLRDVLCLDGAITYRNGRLADELKRAAPEGIDVYFDNVGGDHLEAAITPLRPHGRVAMCGTVASYSSAGTAPGPANMFQIVSKRLVLRGFRTGDFIDALPEMRAGLGQHLDDGAIECAERSFEGIGSVVHAMNSMLDGHHVGKTLCRLA
jgi:NADPH-dependent curcumin reductase CurA